jgi:hypothetical protein
MAGTFLDEVKALKARGVPGKPPEPVPAAK